MSVPARRGPLRGGAKWETILSALDSNARTVRLCLILFVASIPAVVGLVTLALRSRW